MSKRIWLAASVVCAFGTFCLTEALAQRSIDLSGKWTVEKVSLKGGDAIGITEQNCTWCGHFNTNVPMVVGKDQKVAYQFEGEPKRALFKLEGEVKMKVVFLNSPDIPEGGTIEEYSVYDFKVVGDGFTLSRQDPAITEFYQFKRIP
jgi:hypothetical protein